MRYIPGLLPERSQTDLNIYYPRITRDPKKHTVWLISGYIGALVFFIMALATIFTHFWDGFMYLVLAFIFLPPGHQFLEKKLRFRFTWPIKTMVFMVLFIPAMTITGRYAPKKQVSSQAVPQEKPSGDSIAQSTQVLAENREKSRKDSLNAHMALVEKNASSKKYKNAIRELSSALAFAIGKDKITIIEKRASYLFKSGKYADAAGDYSSLIAEQQSTGENYFRRALCYQKLNKKAHAVSDLRNAIKTGHPDAEKLYHKINPVKRRIIDYQILCCDGSVSYSQHRRGTCSHHGGVCNWNAPVYEEYREF